jgi:hypothetical protein
VAISRNQFKGFRTSTNVNGKPRESMTNGSSSRKYTGKDVFENNDVHNSDVRSNSEHIIDHAAGLKTTGMVVAHAAQIGLAQLQAIRAQLQGINPNSQPNGARIPAFDDHDLRVQQSSFSADIRAALGVHPVASVQRRLSDQAHDLIRHSVNNFFPISLKGEGVSVNTAVADIDHVSVEMHQHKGVLDMFYASIQFTVPRGAMADGSIRAMRIFRATVANPDFFYRQPARLSVNAIDRLCAQPLRTRKKNQDHMGQYERQLASMDIDNALSALNPTDPLRKLRVQSSDDRITATDHHSAHDRPSGDGVADANLASFIDPISFRNLDRSVALDLKSIKNLQLQNPHLSVNRPGTGINVGSAAIIANAGKLGKEALRQNRTNFAQANRSNFIIDKANKLEFKEIAVLAPDKLNGRLVGDHVEYTFEDYTIHYARSYRYYIVTVDDNMAESTRSKIVQINVDGLRIPQAPTRASGYILGNAICLNMTVDDLLVEKFEIYRKDLTGNPVLGTKKISVMNGVQGYHISEDTRPPLPNGFVQIGETINRTAVGGVFYDRDTKPGHKYVYRVYSVDVFGNKSESPREFQIFWPENEKHVDLATPQLMAELDSFTGQVKLTFHCDDTRVTRLFLARRDTSLGQSAFVPPGQIEHIKLGLTDRARAGHRFDDIRFGYDSDKKKFWNGLFENHQEPIVFRDQAVTSERTYQYQLYGIDRFGNRTPTVISPSLFIAIAASVYEPQNLQAHVRNAGSAVSGIELTWQDGNIDIAAEDRVGNRESLLETNVRTLYQVSRRRVGESNWYNFPMTENKSFFDAASPPVSAIFYKTPEALTVPAGFAEQQYLRSIGTQQSASIPSKLVPDPQSPPQVIQNETYGYRVQAFQSGNFISNFSTVVVINASVPVTSPLNFRVKPNDSKARPFYVALNWDTAKESGVVDHWEIERAAVNNVAAAKLNNLNAADFANLEYRPFKNVFAESSRFRERTDDDHAAAGFLGGTGATSLLTGQHHYIDQEVEFGNTYFYRIRSVSVAGGQTSDWVYRGVKITDDSFEKKSDAVLTPNEKNNLSSTIGPMVTKTDFFTPAVALRPTSLTLKSIPSQRVSPIPHVSGVRIAPPAVIRTPVRAIPAPPRATVSSPRPQAFLSNLARRFF